MDAYVEALDIWGKPIPGVAMWITLKQVQDGLYEFNGPVSFPPAREICVAYAFKVTALGHDPWIIPVSGQHNQCPSTT